jgi:CRISPR-associated protein Cas2
LEINVGVFVGQVNARVRENIWERVKKFVKRGRATMVYSANNEQQLGFKVHNSEWEPIDFDGIKLMLRPSPARTKKLSKLRLGYSKASQHQTIKRQTTSAPQARGLPSSYAVIDVETSGLSPSQDEIIEMSALQVIENKVVGTFTALVRGNTAIPNEIEKLTGITNRMINKKGQELVQVLTEFLDFIRTLPIVAHNAPFDMSFIGEACKKCALDPPTNSHIDTLSLSQKLVRDVKKHTLSTMTKHFNIDVGPMHRGLSDCFATKALYEELIKIRS